MTRIILYNIQYCSGFKGSWWEYIRFWKMLFPPKYLDYVMANELKGYAPDVVGFIEIDTGSIRAKKKDKTVFFREFLELGDQAGRVKYTKEGFSKIMGSLPITRKQGNAIISKHKISEVKYHDLNRGTKRIAIESLIEKPGKFRVILVHLALGKKARKEQLEELAHIVNEIEEPVIVMGDFNTFDGIREIRSLLRKTGLKYYPGQRMIPTQPTYNPKNTLDLILTSKEIEVKDYKVLKEMKFSDHLPILVDFELTGKHKRK
ncbi:MAG: endonuclease/exonuclease/phosphatase family protein [Candidatus Woesearchaeota archaeon]